jgi:excisionase family DNA binding protein
MSKTRLSDRILLRIPEAAKALGISRSKAYILVASGQLPGVVRLGSSLRVSRVALEEWVAKNCTKQYEVYTLRDGDPHPTPPAIWGDLSQEYPGVYSDGLGN